MIWMFCESLILLPGNRERRRGRFGNAKTNTLQCKLLFVLVALIILFAVFSHKHSNRSVFMTFQKRRFLSTSWDIEVLVENDGSIASIFAKVRLRVLHWAFTTYVFFYDLWPAQLSKILSIFISRFLKWLSSTPTTLNSSIKGLSNTSSLEAGFAIENWWVLIFALESWWSKFAKKWQ